MVIIVQFCAFSFYDVFMASYFYSISFSKFYALFSFNRMFEKISSRKQFIYSRSMISTCSLLLLNVKSFEIKYISKRSNDTQIYSYISTYHMLFDIPIKVFVNSCQNKKLWWEQTEFECQINLRMNVNFWCQKDAN